MPLYFCDEEQENLLTATSALVTLYPMTTTEAVKVLKQAVALLLGNHPQKVEAAVALIQQVIAGLQARKHK